MRKAANAMLSLVALTVAPFAPLGQVARAATVLSIGDGDTISVLERGQKLKVRLACIDAPETAQSPYGISSRNQLKALLPLGSKVSLRVQAVDRYGRSVAEVIGKGLINLAMVQSGQAFAYRQYLGRCDRGAYLAAERLAQAQRLGVGPCRGVYRGRGTSVMGERVAAAQGLSPRRGPQARPSLALKLLSPVWLRPPANRSARLPGPRSCCGWGTATWIAMGMGWLVRGCAS